MLQNFLNCGFIFHGARPRGSAGEQDTNKALATARSQARKLSSQTTRSWITDERGGLLCPVSAFSPEAAEAAALLKCLRTCSSLQREGSTPRSARAPFAECTSLYVGASPYWK